MIANEPGGIRRSNIRGGIRSNNDATATVLDPLTIAYLIRVATAGGNLTTPEINAVDKYAKGLRADGVVAAGFLLRENLCVGDYIALPVPFINTLGGTVDVLSAGFSSADYDRTKGLQGNLSGVVKSGALANATSINSGGLSVYVRDNVFGTNQQGHGAVDSSNNYFAILAPYVDQQLYTIFYGLDGSFSTGVASFPWGHLVGQRTASGRNVGYQAGLQIGINTTPSVMALPAVEIAFFTINNAAGTAPSTSTNLLAEWGIIAGASDALILAWSQRLKTFQTDLGR